MLNLKNITENFMKKDIFTGISPEVLKKRKKSPQPDFVDPMLATLTTHYFSSAEWIYEHKFDGERCLAVKKKGKVHLMSRNKKEMNESYPELVAALEAQEADNCIIDGEIVALNKDKISDFELLQSRMNLQDLQKVAHRSKTVPIYYRIFDVVHAQGYDLRDMPLLSRKSILKKLLHYNTILTYTTHRSPDGIAYFKMACDDNWEGLIAKKADSRYVGVRSKNWLKFKCASGQELVIGGYTSPQGSRTDFGALLVGYYDGDNLMFAGKVGTGFDQKTLTFLGKKLRALARKTCPFANYDGPQKNVHWVKPELVADFKFAQWTNNNKLRVPRYKGLRNDKRAHEVVKEVPK
jgi:DNA ligase D-like protein (predicted ligase)